MYPWPITHRESTLDPFDLVGRSEPDLNRVARALELPRRLLAVFAHPDDEIGAAGTIAEVVRAGGAVKIVWLTRGELASQFGDAPFEAVCQAREAHGRAVAALLGAEYSFLEFPDAGLTGGRDEAMAIARIIAEFKPDALLTWDPFDMHPDHRAAYWACLSSLKLCRIPKLMGAAHREPVRLYHYYCHDLPRAQVYAEISPSLPALEAVYGLYHAIYHWPWTTDDLRRGRALIGARVGALHAERFQIANLEHAEGLPVIEGIPRSLQTAQAGRN